MEYKVSTPSKVSAEERVRCAFRESIEVKTRLLEEHISGVTQLAGLMTKTLQSDRKIVLFGNGGSAADAQHVAGELVNRFLVDRDALGAIALTTDTSVLTSIGNDYDFDQIFSRQVRALVQRGDMVAGISTSGNSPNVNNGLIAAKEKGATTVGFTGCSGGELEQLVDICCCVPSYSTPRIQEAHITIWHAVCEIVEQEIFCN